MESVERERATRDLWAIHERVGRMYDWGRVARATQSVYGRAMCERRRTDHRPLRTFVARLYKCGWGFGLFFTLVTVVVQMILRVCEMIDF